LGTLQHFKTASLPNVAQAAREKRNIMIKGALAPPCPILCKALTSEVRTKIPANAPRNCRPSSIIQVGSVWVNPPYP
jgi:hypothetical protein